MIHFAAQIFDYKPDACTTNQPFKGESTEDRCGYGLTGTIKKSQISTIEGVETIEINTCCTSPKFYAGENEDGSNLCTCQLEPMQTANLINEGYVFDATKRKWNAEVYDNDEFLSDSGRVIDSFLSEN